MKELVSTCVFSSLVLVLFSAPLAIYTILHPDLISMLFPSLARQ